MPIPKNIAYTLSAASSYSNKNKVYYEKCDQTEMSLYPFFLPHLKKIQKLCKKIRPEQNDILSITSQSSIRVCDKCNASKYYRLGNIIWPSNIPHTIKKHHMYPSEYFIKVIANTSIIENTIVNPPLEISQKQIRNFSYVPLHYNKLLIIDALMHQGSQKRYFVPKNKNSKNKFIYSEHSGVIVVKNRLIDNIIVSTETNRVDAADENIYLPINAEIFKKHEYLFHTHPNSTTYAGRVPDGILYEFPSANDIANFVRYHSEGIVQASLVVAPEGIYVIRQIWDQNAYEINLDMYDYLKKFILKLEKIAIKNFKPILPEITDPDIFHTTVAIDMSYIRKYNRFLEPYNLFIEYYPRNKINNEWRLPQINLQYLDKN